MLSDSSAWRRMEKDARAALRSWQIRPLPRLWEATLAWAQAKATRDHPITRLLPAGAQVAQFYVLLLLFEMHRDRPWLTSKLGEAVGDLAAGGLALPGAGARRIGRPTAAQRRAAATASRQLGLATIDTPPGECDRCHTRYPATPGQPVTTACGCGGKIVRDYGACQPRAGIAAILAIAAPALPQIEDQSAGSNGLP